MSRFHRFTATIPLFTMLPMPAAMAQSSVAVSPFVSYVPSAARNPLAGMSLTFGGTTGLALRGSADIALSDPGKSDRITGSGGYRPWSADADALLFLGGLGGGATVFSRSLSPYLFSGIGLTGGDSAGVNVVHDGWSYGAGATIPLGLDADVFAEARWRMLKYVLPTAKSAPDSRSELRFGLSFHVGGSEAAQPRRRHSRVRDDDDEVATRSAPAPQTIVVTQPPAPPPTVIVTPQPQTVVVPAAEPPPSPIVVNLPGVIVLQSRRGHEDRECVARTVRIARHRIVLPC